MNEYKPHKWMVVKITGKDTPPVHKVFACWYGGYLEGDSWKLNSGITKVTEKEDYFFFEGSSGSVYECDKGLYGASGFGTGILQNMSDRLYKVGGKIEILPEETNWLEINYE